MISDYTPCKGKYLLLITGLLWGAVLHAAPAGNYAPLPATIQNLNNNISELRHRSHNQEVELNQVEERFGSMESIVEGLRKQVTELSRTFKDQSESSRVSLESRIGNLELMAQRVLSDLQVVKNHVNDSAVSLSQYKQQLQDYKQQMQLMEQHSAQQNQNIDNLQTALKVLTEALQVGDEKETLSEEYKVKAGDSLEKIAQAHGTSVKVLKELNGLTTDRIKINQKLKLPVK